MHGVVFLIEIAALMHRSGHFTDTVFDREQQ